MPSAAARQRKQQAAQAEAAAKAKKGSEGEGTPWREGNRIRSAFSGLPRLWGLMTQARQAARPAPSVP